MEKNDIYELSQLLGNQNGLENDFSQIITTLKDTLQKNIYKNYTIQQMKDKMPL